MYKNNIKILNDKIINLFEDMSNILHYSPLVFLLNIIINISRELYVYANIFSLLMLSSLIYHRFINIYTHICDKLMIIIVITYGTNILYQYVLLNNLTIYKYCYICNIILAFIITFYIFVYGMYKKKYCFDKDKKVGNYYHAFLHLISSIGHIMIALLN
jgi:hypothetical protein